MAPKERGGVVSSLFSPPTAPCGEQKQEFSEYPEDCRKRVASPPLAAKTASLKPLLSGAEHHNNNAHSRKHARLEENAAPSATSSGHFHTMMDSHDGLAGGGLVPLFGPLFGANESLMDFADSTRGSGSEDDIDMPGAVFAGGPCDSDSGMSFAPSGDEHSPVDAALSPFVSASGAHQTTVTGAAAAAASVAQLQHLDAMWTVALPESENPLPKITHEVVFSFSAAAQHHHVHTAQAVGERLDIGKALLHGRVDLDSLSTLDGGLHDMRSSTSSTTFHSSGGLGGLAIDKSIGPAQRFAHNAMERERRVNLRKCFDSLRAVLPRLRDSKAASLQVLNEACTAIVDITREERALVAAKALLVQENQALRAALAAKQQQQAGSVALN